MSLPNLRLKIPASARAGFTLPELLVVVAIIGLLAGYVGLRYFGSLGRDGKPGGSGEYADITNW